MSDPWMALVWKAGVLVWGAVGTGFVFRWAGCGCLAAQIRPRRCRWCAQQTFGAATAFVFAAVCWYAPAITAWLAGRIR